MNGALGMGVRGLESPQDPHAVSLGLQPQRLLTFNLVQGSASLGNEICPSCTARLHRSSKLSFSIGLAHHLQALEKPLSAEPRR